MNWRCRQDHLQTKCILHGSEFGETHCLLLPSRNRPSGVRSSLICMCLRKEWNTLFKSPLTSLVDFFAYSDEDGDGIRRKISRKSLSCISKKFLNEWLWAGYNDKEILIPQDLLRLPSVVQSFPLDLPVWEPELILDTIIFIVFVPPPLHTQCTRRCS